MSQSNILFEDLLEVESIDKDIKVFEKVQRIEGKTEDSNCEIILDVNSEIYPMQKTCYSILLSKSLNTDGTPSPNNFNYDNYIKKDTLMDKYDYVMYGKVFKFTEENNGNITISCSFGGLLFSISGQPSAFNNINVDERIYLLLKKIVK